MKTVHYHQHGKLPLVLFVVALHSDGTVDLAREDKGEPIITNIALSEEAGDGKAVPFEASEATGTAPKKGTKAKKAAETPSKPGTGNGTDAPVAGDEGDDEGAPVVTAPPGTTPPPE